MRFSPGVCFSPGGVLSLGGVLFPKGCTLPHITLSQPFVGNILVLPPNIAKDLSTYNKLCGSGQSYDIAVALAFRLKLRHIYINLLILL